MSCSRAQPYRQWGSNPGPLDSEYDALLLLHRAPRIVIVIIKISHLDFITNVVLVVKFA